MPSGEFSRKPYDYEIGVKSKSKEKLAKRLVDPVSKCLILTDPTPVRYLFRGQSAPKRESFIFEGHQKDTDVVSKKDFQQLNHSELKEEIAALSGVIPKDDMEFPYSDREPRPDEVTIRFVKNKGNTTTFIIGVGKNYRVESDEESPGTLFDIQYLTFDLPNQQADQLYMEVYSNPYFLELFAKELAMKLGKSSQDLNLSNLKTAFIASSPGAQKGIPAANSSQQYTGGVDSSGRPGFSGFNLNFSQFRQYVPKNSKSVARKLVADLSRMFGLELRDLPYFTSRRKNYRASPSRSSQVKPELLIRKRVIRPEIEKQNPANEQSEKNWDDDDFDSTGSSGSLGELDTSLVSESTQPASAEEVFEQKQLAWKQRLDQLLAKIENPGKRTQEELEVLLKKEAEHLGLSENAAAVLNQKIKSIFSAFQEPETTAVVTEVEPDSREIKTITPELATQIRRMQEHIYYVKDIFGVIKGILGESLPAFTLWQSLLRSEIKKEFNANSAVMKRAMDALDRLYDLVEKIQKKEVDKSVFDNEKKKAETTAFWDFANSETDLDGGVAGLIELINSANKTEFSVEFIEAMQELESESK